MSVDQFSAANFDPPVRGFLHRPATPRGDGLVLTHGAGGNANMALLVSLAEAFAGTGFAVLRCNLPFRQARPFGPPRPAEAPRDRAGLKNAVDAMRNVVPGRIFLSGQSYGGRQASMLLAERQTPKNLTTENTELHRGTATEQDERLSPHPQHESGVHGLLLLSYPLHPPGRPDQLRTQHLPKLNVPTLFVQGTNDPFASIAEIDAARKLVPATTRLLTVEGAGHDLGFKGKKHHDDLPAVVLNAFQEIFA